MPNEITIKIKVENDSAKGYEEALLAGREFGAKLKEEFDRAGKEAGNQAANEIKRQLEEMNPPSIDLNVKDEEAKVKIKEVEEELLQLDQYGDEIKIKIKEEDIHQEATKVKAKLKEDMKDDGGAGKGWAQSFTKSLQEFDFKPGLLPVALAVGAAFLPLIGAGIAGLIVGGAGLGGIVGGVILAAKDPRVKSEFQAMKKDLGNALKLDAAPFVPVVQQGILDVDRALKRIDFGSIFKDLAPQVQPVLGGLLSLISSVGEAIKNIAHNSGPVLKELGTDFRNLGNTLEAGLNSLTDNSHQEAQALHDLFAVIDGSITITFDLVNALTELYGAFHKIIDLSPIGFYELMQDHSQKVTGAVNDTVAAVLDNVDANGHLKTSMKEAADAAAAETKAVQDTADALKAATDPAFALIDAQKQVNDAQSAYNKAVKKGGENSTAARDAQTKLDKAMLSYVSAAAKAGGGTGHLTDEQKNLLKAAHASAGTIKDLDDKLHAAWVAAHKLDGFNIDINVNLKGNGAAIAGGTPTGLSLTHHATGGITGMATGGISGAASGATSSDWTWVGENGPELRKLPAGTAIKSHGDSMRMAGGPDAAGGPTIIELHLDGHVIARAMAEPQRKFVQQNFGGNVQRAYGVGV